VFDWTRFDSAERSAGDPATKPCLLLAGPTGLRSCICLSYTVHVAAFPDELARCTGFEWNEGNSEKNWQLHQVTRTECEEVFFNRPILVAPDVGHSQREVRYAALGITNLNRRLAIVFTIRSTLVRVISARDMSRRERRVYEQAGSKK
jgi:uncharacterized protein